MPLECIGKKYDKILTGKAQRYAPDVKVYHCDKIFLKKDTAERDVTSFIKGIYRPKLREIWLSPYADESTIKHEIAHAIIHCKNPELYEEAKSNIEIAFLIEQRARSLERKIEL